MAENAFLRGWLVSLRLAAIVLIAMAAAGCAQAAPDGDPAPPSPPAPAGIEVEPVLAARLAKEAGARIDLSAVLVVGQAGDETIVVAGTQPGGAEAAHGGHAAQVWIALGDKPFRLAIDYVSYDYACLNADPVCPKVRPGGLGFAAVRQQPGGRIFVLVGATRDRPVRVTTAEGKADDLGPIPGGAVVEVTTAQPAQIRIEASMPDGSSYQLMLPPFGVIKV